MLAASLMLAQNTTTSDNDMVTVPKKYVSSEGLQHQGSAAESVSKWVGIGREIGIATKEGLSAVITESEHFGTTKVGNFVMILVAWKVIGKDLLGVVLGVPIFAAGVCLWIWSYRRFFLGYRMLVKVDKATKTKEWKHVESYDFASKDSKAVCGLAHAMFLAAWCIVWIAIIF